MESFEIAWEEMETDVAKAECFECPAGQTRPTVARHIEREFDRQVQPLAHAAEKTQVMGEVVFVA